MAGLYEKKYLMHYGVPKRSGRYPWGSGERPFQGDEANKAARKDRAKAKKNVRKDRTNAKKNIRTMSDKELEDRISRLNKEKRLKELADEDLYPGKKAVKSILSGIGTAVGIAVASTAIFYTIGKLASSTKKETVPPDPNKSRKNKERYKYKFDKEEFRKAYNVAEMFELSAKKGLKQK